LLESLLVLTKWRDPDSSITGVRYVSAFERRPFLTFFFAAWLFGNLVLALVVLLSYGS